VPQPFQQANGQSTSCMRICSGYRQLVASRVTRLADMPRKSISTLASSPPACSGPVRAPLHQAEARVLSRRRRLSRTSARRCSFGNDCNIRSRGSTDGGMRAEIINAASIHLRASAYLRAMVPEQKKQKKKKKTKKTPAHFPPFSPFFPIPKEKPGVSEKLQMRLSFVLTYDFKIGYIVFLYILIK